MRVPLLLFCVSLLAGCVGALDTNADAGVLDGAPVGTTTGSPPCVPGIRETACVSPDGPDAAADGRTPVTPAAGIDSAGGLGVPLHPELSRPCARVGSVRLYNPGNDPLTVSGMTLTGSPAFTLEGSRCTHTLAEHLSCYQLICFTSASPGVHEAALTWTTSLGVVQGTLSNEVLLPTPGLDTSFAQTGALAFGAFPTTDSIRGAALLNDGESIAVWARDFGFERVRADGTREKIPGGPTPPGAWAFQTLRAGAPGQGFYAVIVEGPIAAALIRFSDDGTRDMGFAGSGAIILSGFQNAYPSIEVHPSGRLIVVGTDKAFAGARAFGPDGEEVESYRTTIANPLLTAIDDRGRLYATSPQGLLRLNPDGGIDAGFSYGGSVEAMVVDREQRLLVFASGTMARLDDAGNPSPIPLPTASVIELRLPTAGIAVDARGRILVTPLGGAAVRFLEDGTLDTHAGFDYSGVQAVICPRQGGCWVAGILHPVATNSIEEDYVLRLAP